MNNANDDTVPIEDKPDPLTAMFGEAGASKAAAPGTPDPDANAAHTSGPDAAAPRPTTATQPTTPYPADTRSTTAYPQASQPTTPHPADNEPTAAYPPGAGWAVSGATAATGAAGAAGRGSATATGERSRPRATTIVWGAILLVVAALALVASRIQPDVFTPAFAIWTVVGLGALLVVGGIVGAIARAVTRAVTRS